MTERYAEEDGEIPNEEASLPDKYGGQSTWYWEPPSCAPRAVRNMTAALRITSGKQASESTKCLVEVK